MCTTSATGASCPITVGSPHVRSTSIDERRRTTRASRCAAAAQRPTARPTRAAACTAATTSSTSADSAATLRHGTAGATRTSAARATMKRALCSPRHARAASRTRQTASSLREAARSATRQPPFEGGGFPPPPPFFFPTVVYKSRSAHSRRVARPPRTLGSRRASTARHRRSPCRAARPPSPRRP